MTLNMFNPMTQLPVCDQQANCPLLPLDSTDEIPQIRYFKLKGGGSHGE